MEDSNKMDVEAVVDAMGENYPHPVIPRKDIPKFTNGMLSYKGQVNLDARGEGPPSFLCGRQRGYDKAAYCRWLKKKILRDSSRKPAGGYSTHKKNRKSA